MCFGTGFGCTPVTSAEGEVCTIGRSLSRNGCKKPLVVLLELIRKENYNIRMRRIGFLL